MTDNIFQRLAIDVRESIDAEQLVYELLNRAYPCEEWPDVKVCSELDLPLNAYGERGQVLLYYVSAPEQFDRGLWRFGVTFTVLAADCTILTVLHVTCIRRCRVGRSRSPRQLERLAPCL